MKLKYDSNELVFIQYIAGMNALGQSVNFCMLTKMIRSYNMRECYLLKDSGDFSKKPDSLAENARYAKLLIEKFEVEYQDNYKMYLSVYRHINKRKN